MFIETSRVKFQKDRELFYEDIKHLEFVAMGGHKSKQQQEI